jgi:hypothetical protein
MLSQFLHPLTADNKVRACLCCAVLLCCLYPFAHFCGHVREEGVLCTMVMFATLCECFSVWAWNAAHCPPLRSSIIFM